MNPFLIIAALLILYSLKTTNKVFSLSGVPAVPKQQHKPDKPSGRSVIDPGSIHVDLLRTAICNQKKRYSRVITTSPLPFNKVFIWVLLSYVVSSFISIAGIQNTFTSLLSVVFAISSVPIYAGC